MSQFVISSARVPKFTVLYLRMHDQQNDAGIKKAHLIDALVSVSWMLLTRVVVHIAWLDI